MIDNTLNRKVLLEKSFEALASVARSTYTREIKNDIALVRGINYTNPEVIPNGFGVFSLIVILDSRAEEMTPQLLVTSNTEAFNDLIMKSLGRDAKPYVVKGDAIQKHAMITYSDFNKSSLGAVSSIDYKGVLGIIGEMLAEDLTYVKQYIQMTNGDRNRLIFEYAQVQTPYGLLIKEGNKFYFPDGLIFNVVVTGRNPDGSIGWDFEVILGNEIMRGTKHDATFANRNLNQNNSSYSGNNNGFNNNGFGW